MTIPHTVSPASVALAAFASGEPFAIVDGHEHIDLLRLGAREVIEECERLRAILSAMSRAKLGEGALVEIHTPTVPPADGTTGLRFVVCCASQSEQALAEGIFAVVRDIFGRLEVDMTVKSAGETGTQAMHKEPVEPETSEKQTADPARPLSLYLVTTREPVGYDEYSAFVVAAETETAARTLAANAAHYSTHTDEEAEATCWGNPGRSTCVCVGVADPSVERGVVLDSFNAG